MYMQGGDAFNGRDGRLYEHAGEVELCDVAQAHAKGWRPATEPEKAPQKAEKPDISIPVGLGLKIA